MQYFKKIPTTTQDLSRRCIATSGESVSTYPRRPKAEALSNAVDVVECLRDPTDQVPNARHLRDLHTYSSVTSLELLIQLRPRESFRQRDGVVTVMIKLLVQGFAKALQRYDRGGLWWRRAPHTAKRSMINFCVHGVPPPPYIKE